MKSRRALANVSQIVVEKCLMQEARGGGRRGGGGGRGPGGLGRGDALTVEGRRAISTCPPTLEFEADVTGVEKPVIWARRMTTNATFLMALSSPSPANVARKDNRA